jgi:hypothetical protein
MSTMEGNEALREKYSFERITQKDGTNKKGIEKIVCLAFKDQNEVKSELWIRLIQSHSKTKFSQSSSTWHQNFFFGPRGRSFCKFLFKDSFFEKDLCLGFEKTKLLTL